MKSKIAVIFNPGAAWGRAQKTKLSLLKELRKNKIDFDFFESRSEDHLLQLARQAGSAYQYLLCVGGDTTFHLVLNELMKIPKRPIMGIFGVGSSNDIARHFGLIDLGNLGQALRKNVYQEIDVGAIFVKEELQRYFLGQVSLGLGVTINRFVANWLKRFPFLQPWVPLLGFWGFVFSYLRKEIPFPLVLEGGGRKIRGDIILAVISNTNYWANGRKINPFGQVNDGLGEAFVFKPGHLIRLVKLYQAIRDGHHLQAREVLSLQGNFFSLSSSHPLALQVDGERLFDSGDEQIKEIKIKIIPKALRMITPQP